MNSSFFGVNHHLVTFEKLAAAARYFIPSDQNDNLGDSFSKIAN